MAVKKKSTEQIVMTRVPSQYVKEMDSYVSEGYAINRSDFIRDALRSKLEILKKR